MEPVEAVRVAAPFHPTEFFHRMTQPLTGGRRTPAVRRTSTPTSPRSSSPSRSPRGPRRSPGGSGGSGTSPVAAAAAALDAAIAEALERPEPVIGSFAELGLPQPLVAALARGGVDAPFAIQSRALPDALAGRDVLGRAQTGSGKTLAFGLPMLTRLAASGRPPDAERAARASSSSRPASWPCRSPACCRRSRWRSASGSRPSSAALPTVARPTP